MIMKTRSCYLKFLHLESNAKLIITDSGGLQEEACILGIPCVTLRENTERPETIEVGSRRPGRDRCTNHYREEQEHARQKNRTGQIPTATDMQRGGWWMCWWSRVGMKDNRISSRDLFIKFRSIFFSYCMFIPNENIQIIHI